MLRTETLRKVTVQVPAHLLKDAQTQTRSGITQTITAGLEKLAAGAAYKRLLKMEGCCKINVDIAASRQDR